jgi:tRNA-dihydrouridine synthase B
MQIKNIQIKDLILPSPIILAPMAGITNLPYRRVMKSFGAGLVFSEMISANGMIRDGKKTRLLLESHHSENPLGIQLFGDDPTVLAQAAKMVADAGSMIDINMGCPVKKVVRNGAGSALLQSTDRVKDICIAVRKAYPGPLTIKIRSGWDEQSVNFQEVGKIAENEGIDAITLHARTRSQGFSGHSDWTHLAELKNILNIPVFGSGDIFTPEDGIKMFQETGCDAIMIGRGGYGNPWIIRQILDLIEGRKYDTPSPDEVCSTALNHLELHLAQFGEHKALLEMRKHLSWYARGLSGASHFRAALQQITNISQLQDTTQSFFLQNRAA